MTRTSAHRLSTSALTLLLCGATVTAIGAGCNRRVFEKVKPTCDVTIASDVDIPDEKAADILIVVDNSGSMQEEQDNLAENFLNPNIAECPIGVNNLADFVRCDEDDPPATCAFANPSPELLAAPGPDGLADCGFIQILAAFENDFRIGVVTTDVGLCDNRFSSAQGGAFCGANPGAEECGQGDGGGWGYRPQRGCLQPNGPPGTALKVIARADLLDDDPTNDDIGGRFEATLSNIRIFGTAFERGLDAMKDFLDPASSRGPGCENDLESFLREDAKLVVIFLSDEEDCSRFGDNTALVDEFGGEVCDEFQAHFTNSAAACYDQVDQLTAVSEYADFLRSVKPNATDVSVAVIAGGTKVDDDVIPEGCRIQGGDPVGGCFASGGNSNGAICANNLTISPNAGDTDGDGLANGADSAPDDPCLPNAFSPACAFTQRQCDGGGCAIPCCVADGGGRYFALADAFAGQSVKDSICFESFRQTMIEIATFIADVDFIKLAEKPENPALVFVEKTLASSGEVELVTRLNGTTCGNANGWVLEEDGVTVRFCGDARPGPGETIRVRAKGAGAESEDADACANR